MIVATATVLILTFFSAQGEAFNANPNPTDHEDPTKVFGLGLTAKGNKFMAEAMEILGYKSIQADSSLSQFMHHPEVSPDLIGYYDSVDTVWDIPTAAYYRELLLAYPDAKFILTTATDSKAWYDTLKHQLDGCGDIIPERVQRLNDFVYGSRLPSDSWIGAFQQHNEDVKSFFAEHAPKQLLEVDESIILKEPATAMETVCDFLGNTDGPCVTDSRLFEIISTELRGCSTTPNASLDAFPFPSLSKNKEDSVRFTGTEAKYAYVTLLCDPAAEERAGYLQMLLVLRENIRTFDQENDIVTLLYGSISNEQKEVLDEFGIKIVEVDTVGRDLSDREPLRVPDTESACYRAKLNALRLTQYEKVIFLDSDMLLKQDLQFMFKDSFDFLAYAGYEAPLNTGLFSVVPSQQAFTDLHDILLSDSFDPQDGWLGVGPFPHWRLSGQVSDWSFWCAHTDQGVLYYYYDMVVNADEQNVAILPKKEGEKLFKHFVGWEKPLLHDKRELAEKGALSEWYHLHETAKARLEKGSSNYHINSNSSKVKVPVVDVTQKEDIEHRNLGCKMICNGTVITRNLPYGGVEVTCSGDWVCIAN